MRRIGEHAVVIGASMAGLPAAAALADAYERVTVLDRDTLPDGFEGRRAVPQGKDPKDLWLELVVRKPTPPAANQRQIVVRYEETSDIAYKTVTIFPNRAAIPVTVPENPSPAGTGNG